VNRLPNHLENYLGNSRAGGAVKSTLVCARPRVPTAAEWSLSLRCLQTATCKLQTCPLRVPEY
jgi:hypothetical protein